MARSGEVKVKVDMDHPAIKKGVKAAHDEGFQLGLAQGRKEILDYLEHAYMNDPGRPDRGTPKAEAILEMAREASEHFKKKMKRGK